MHLTKGGSVRFNLFSLFSQTGPIPLSKAVDRSPDRMKPPQWKLFFRQAGTYGFTQLILQAVGLLAGVIIVRHLSPQQYALYTLALTMLGVMNVLADGGISTGAMAEGGKVWKDPFKLGVVIRTAQGLRQRFALAGVAMAVPFLIYLLRSHGASWSATFTVSAGVILMFYTSLSDSILELPSKLHQLIAPLSRIRCFQALGRLALVSLASFISPLAGAILLLTVLPQWWGNRQLQRISGEVVSIKVDSDPQVQKKILSIVARVMPGAIFYCISGQISIWLITLFGNTHSIAAVGALGRLGQLTTIFGVFITGVLIPRFARLPPEKHLLTQWTCGIIGFTILCGLLIVGTGATLGEHLLKILGPSYQGLEKELNLLLVASSIGLVSSAFYNLGAARGWIIRPWITIPVILITNCIFIPLIDLTTLRGPLLLNILTALPSFIMVAAYIIYRIQKTPVLNDSPA